MNEQRTSAAKVLFTSTIGLAFGVSAVTTASFGAFVLPLVRTFGWERGDVSFAMTLGNFFNILAFPVAGLLVDRFGVRRVLIPSILLFGLALANLAFLSGSIWHLYAGYIILAACGVGTSTVSYTRLIVTWFSAKRGRALGTVLAGMGVSVAFLPIFVQKITELSGWRTAYLALAGLVVIAVLPFAVWWVWYPQKSASKAPVDSGNEVSASAPGGLPFHIAVKSKSFILLSIAFALLGVLTGAIPTHLVPLLVERGIPAMLAAEFAASLGISLIIGRLIMGYLMDRFFAPFLMIGIIAIAVVGLSMMWSGVTGPWAVVAICLIGFTVGADVDSMSYLISRYIGLRAYTRIYGLMLAAFTLGVGVGPAVMGFSANTTGNYNLGLQILIVTMTISSVPFAFLGRYQDSLPDSARQPTETARELDTQSPSSHHA